MIRIFLSSFKRRSEASAIKTEKYEVYRCKKEGTAKAWQFFYCVKESLNGLVFLNKNQRKN